MLLNTIGKSPLGFATPYTLIRWHKLNLYTTDGNFQIDNNLVENSIRTMASGRKNNLFAGSHQAAEKSSKFYSFFEKCKRVNVTLFKWLKYVLENINDCKVK
jgi:transposase